MKSGSHKFPRWLSGKESTCQCWRHGFNSWAGKISWRRNGNPLQCSCLENPLDEGAWQTPVYEVVKRQTRLNTDARAAALGFCQRHITGQAGCLCCSVTSLSPGWPDPLAAELSTVFENAALDGATYEPSPCNFIYTSRLHGRPPLR